MHIVCQMVSAKEKMKQAERDGSVWGVGKEEASLEVSREKIQEST